LKALRKSLAALAPSPSPPASSLRASPANSPPIKASATALRFRSSVERLLDNASIAQRFRALGFTGVRVSGSGATRKVEGVWPGKDMSANMPRQIVAVAKL
jgi:hypothetical protein